MDRSDTAIRNVLVAGDATLDWNLAQRSAGDSAGAKWASDPFTRACWQRGGAALLADLIAAVAERVRCDGRLDGAADISVERPPALTEPPRPDDRRFHHSYALWSYFESKAWRVKQFLGLDRAAAAGEVAPAAQSSQRADIVVLDDANLGFRQAREFWPRPLCESKAPKWIVLKISRPVAEGPLWEHLLANFADRLVVVMTVNDLRRTEVQISRGLSWERTAQDVVWELVHNPRVNGVSRCAHAVVSFNTAGAVLLSREQDGQERAQLFFDPQHLEDGWEADRPGRMIGNTVTLAAAVVRQLFVQPDRPDMPRAVQAAVAAMRHLFVVGYGGGQGDAEQANVVFPVVAVAEKLATEECPLAAVPIQDPVRFLTGHADEQHTPSTPGLWRILDDQYREGLDRLAESVVCEGIESALRDVPMGRIGGLTTVDRREMEALRSVQNLMAEYCAARQKRPLSIAVFGPPGSGKSFGVEHVARSVRAAEIVKLEFNLSQFTGPDELLGAYHQVRDAALKGTVPLVFWDEFDTPLGREPLGWLRYFLSPMQDGSFLEGQIVHPIGQCIFVFAGGTSARMSEFAADLAVEQRKAAKVPDFVSRLKGFLDVLGPNCQQTDKDSDPHFILRRALLLRSILDRNTPQLFSRRGGKKALHVDSGVLRALLHTKRYRHGARSIESIIAMSSLRGRNSFERSALPSDDQLELHVEAQDFRALVQQIVLTGDLLERLAAAAHDVYRAGKERDGWTLGPRDNEKKTHPLLVPYEQIPEWAKDSNRTNVRTIPRKLAAAGYVMIPARSNEPALEFPGDDLETLAQLEHQLWMDAKLADGFRPGQPTAEDPRRSEYLVPWEQVPGEIKQIDRDLVRGIPEILSRAGYAVERVRQIERRA